MSDATAVATRPEQNGTGHALRLTPEMERMDAIARQAKALAASTIIPAAYRDQPSNCLVAIDMAMRTGVPALTVMQNLHIIKGRPAWSASFLIGAVNACGRFSPLRFEVQGEIAAPGWKCRVVATSLDDGEVLDGPWVTWEMAQSEGWTGRNGSKWLTMPDLMIRYRSAAFWSRLFAPEIALGLMTSEEVTEIGPSERDRREQLAAALDREEPVSVEAEFIEDFEADEAATAAGNLPGLLED